jgi:hypothetical protein
MNRIALRLWHSPTFMTWGSLASRLLGVAIVLPLVLTHFTPSEVAVWQLFVVIYTLQLMFDFGLSPTFSRVLAYGRGGLRLSDFSANGLLNPPKGYREADRSVLTTILCTQRWVYLRIAAFAGIFFAVVGTLAMQKPISYLPSPGDGWICWIAVLLSNTVALWGSGYGAALQGMNHIAESRRWEAAFSIAQIISSVAVIANGGGLLALVISNQFWLIACALRNRYLMNRLHPDLMGASAEVDSRVLKSVLPAAWRSGLGVLMSQGVVQASGLYYSQMHDSKQAASYLLALRLITMISQFSQAPFYSKLPTLAEMLARGDREGMLKISQRGMATAHWVFVLGAISVSMLADWLLSIIGSKTPFVQPFLWLVMSVAFFLERYGAMYLQLYSTTNHIVWHIANGVTGVFMVSIAFFLQPSLGIYAFPVAMLVAYFSFYCWYSVRLAVRAYSIDFGYFELKCALPPVAFVALVSYPLWVLRNALL